MRIRTVKPEFWAHEAMCTCPEFTRLLALALLNYADDEGYFMAHPNLIRGSLFPFDDDSTSVRRALAQLVEIGWIMVGSDAQGRAVGKVRNFDKHQRIDRPQPSKIKASSTFDDDSTIDRRRFDDDSLLEQGTGNREQGTGNRE